MALNEQVIEAFVELAINSPHELERGRGADPKDFLERHPQVRHEIEIIMFDVSNSTGITRETAEIVLNLIVPKLLDRVARKAAAIAAAPR